MAPYTLMISWQVVKDICSPNTRTAPSSTTNHVPCEPYSTHTDADYMICTRQPLSRQGISHSWAVTDPSVQELSCTRSSYYPSGSHSIVCMQDISRHQENIYPLIISCISSSLDIRHLLHYDNLRCTKTERQK